MGDGVATGWKVISLEEDGEDTVRSRAEDGTCRELDEECVGVGVKRCGRE